MEDPAIVVKVQLTEKDLEDFYAHMSNKSISMKLVIAFGLIVFVAQLIRIVADPNSLEGAIMWVLIVLFIFGMMIYSNKYNARKASRHNKKLFEEYIYSINDKQIQIKGKSLNTTLLWEKLHKVTESKNAFYIWLNKKNAQIIPKRDLSNEEIEVIRIIKKIKMKK